MAKVSEIGKCAGCQKSRALVDGACKDCRDRFGERCGIQMRKIRQDPAFARRCYDYCETDTMKKRFTDMFGVPEGVQDRKLRAC
jgi:hypothetical protein